MKNIKIQSIILMIIIFVSLIISLNSCSTYITKNNLDFELYKTTKDEVIQTLYKNTKVDELIFEAPNNNNHKYEILLTEIKYTNGQDAYYYYLFKDNILLYYGFPYQILHNDDDEIRKLGEFGNRRLLDKLQ